MSNGSRRARAVLPLVGLVAGLLSVAPAAQATFPGSNGLVVFQAAPPPAEGQSSINDIYVSTEDGDDVTNLTNNPANDAYPSWSPDGTTIAFASDRSGSDGMDLYLMDSDGGEVRLLETLPGDQGWTAWSPDGSKIAFSTDTSQISVITVADREVSNLAAGWHPNWSPDGSTIAYINQVGEQTDIYKVSASGGASPVNLTNTASAWEFAPNFSPDGSKILFSSDEGSGFSTVDLYTMTPAGESKTRITSASGWESEPSWSPDGTKIIYTSNTNPMGGGNSVLQWANTNGTGVTPGPSLDGASIDHPDWQPLGGSQPVDVTRKVTLKAVAKGTKLILKGKITSVDAGCNAGQSVAVQKLKSGTFKTLATVTSNDYGVYKKAVKKAKGKYRAVVSASQTASSNCLGATSKTVKFPS